MNAEGIARALQPAKDLLEANGYTIVSNDLVAAARRFVRHYRICYWVERRHYDEAHAAKQKKAKRNAFEMMDFYMLQYSSVRIAMETLGIAIPDIDQSLSDTEQDEANRLYTALVEMEAEGKKVKA